MAGRWFKEGGAEGSFGAEYLKYTVRYYGVACVKGLIEIYE